MIDFLNEQFIAGSFEHRPQHFESVIDSSLGFLSFEVLDQLLNSGGLQATQVDRIGAAGGPLVQSIGKSISDFRLDPRSIEDAIRAGESLRIRGVDYYLPKVRLLAQQICNRLNSKVQVNAYITPPGQRALRPHFDGHDVLVIQTAGEKSWQLYSGYKHETTLPYGNPKFFEDKYGIGQRTKKLTLNEGDVLYIPRGVQHSAAATHRASIHITVGVFPVTLADLLLEQVLTLTEADESLRRSINLSLGSPETHIELRSKLQTAIEKLSALDSNDAITAFRETLEDERSRLSVRSNLDCIIETQEVEQARSAQALSA